MEDTVVSGGAQGGLMLIVQLAIVIVMIAAMWKVFTKAGQPGWAILIPFYGTFVMLKIAGKPGWWLILFFIPIVNIVVWILTAIALANHFGKGGGFAVGLILLPMIFYPILGFGGAEYQAVQA